MRYIAAILIILSTTINAATLRIDVEKSLTHSPLFVGNQTAIQNWLFGLVNTANQSFAPTGLQFEFVSLQIWDNSIQSPFDPSNSANLLWSYETWIAGNPQLRQDFNIIFSGTADSGGGAAIQDSACSPYAIGAVRVPISSFTLATERARSLISHEVGHTLDLDHTHCQPVPLDQCWSGGGFSGIFGGQCYQGPTSCPTQGGRGTAMSICFNGGCAPRTNLPTFHPVQVSQLQQLVQARPCLGLSDEMFVDGFENQTVAKGKRYVIE